MIIVFEDIHELKDWMELHPEYKSQVEIDGMVYKSPKKALKEKGNGNQKRSH